MTFHHFKVRLNLIPPANSCLLNTVLQESSLMDPNPVTQRLRASSIRLLSSNTNINTLQLGSYCVYILNTRAYMYAYSFPHTSMTGRWKPRPRFGNIRLGFTCFPSQVNFYPIYCSLRPLVVNLAYCDKRSPGVTKPLLWGVVLGSLPALPPPKALALP